MFTRIVEKISRYVRAKLGIVNNRWKKFHIGDRKYPYTNKMSPIFVVGTGRCGTHFFYEILKKDHSFKAEHLDSINLEVIDSFVQYSLWNNINVDLAPIKYTRQYLIEQTGQNGNIYVESNPYLSLLIEHLYRWFNAKFILLIRSPKKVVNSHLNKGWYSNIPIYDNIAKTIFPQPGIKLNHSFGRIIPRGQEFINWSELTQVGRIAWWINTLNKEVLTMFQKLPNRHYKIINMDFFDYDKYLDLYYEFLEAEEPIKQSVFEQVKTQRPGKGRKKRTVDDWSKLECKEFDEQTEWLRATFDFNK